MNDKLYNWLKGNLWWVLFLVFIVVFFSSLSFAGAVDNQEEINLKWQMCNAMNFSGKTCDLWWGGFKVSMGISEDNQVNLSAVDDKLVNFYNKTEIDQRLADQNITVNESNCITKTEFDNWTGDFRDSIGENYVSKETFDVYGQQNISSKSDTINPLWVILALVLICLGIWYYSQKKKREKLKDKKLHTPSSPVEKKINDKLEEKKLENKAGNKLPDEE